MTLQGFLSGSLALRCVAIPDLQNIYPQSVQQRSVFAQSDISPMVMVSHLEISIWLHSFFYEKGKAGADGS